MRFPLQWLHLVKFVCQNERIGNLSDFVGGHMPDPPLLFDVLKHFKTFKSFLRTCEFQMNGSYFSDWRISLTFVVYFSVIFLENTVLHLQMTENRENG